MKSIQCKGSVLLTAMSICAVWTGSVAGFAAGSESVALGVVAPPPAHLGLRTAMPSSKRHKSSGSRKISGASRASLSTNIARASKKIKPKAVAKPTRPPQDELGNMSSQTVAPGVVHRFHRGSLNINILDVDLNNPNVEVKPVLAGDSFNRLDEVKDQAQKANAIAAVNANYFKHDGTPLGTLIVDGEWIAGPLYDRVSMGITEDRQVNIDRLNLHGTIETSNPNVSSLWVNNVNQPRRTGSKLIVYTRRWGNACRMAYSGALVAVDSTGKVVDKDPQQLSIPYGGFVLCDSKNSPISNLNRGDLVFLEWHPKPGNWNKVVQAVSGGPTLIRDGQLYLDLQSQRFKKNWTSNVIHARTAVGLTNNKHLILVTVEGVHTLWDVAKMLRKLGCVEAMNLDGGGSTTMVVAGKTVTRNKDAKQRRVATSLAVLSRRQPTQQSVPASALGYVPDTNLTDMGQALGDKTELCDPIAGSLQTDFSADLANVVGVASGLQPDAVVISKEPTPDFKKKSTKSGKRWWQVIP